MPFAFRSMLSMALVAGALTACPTVWAGQAPACLAHDFAQKYPTLVNQTLRVAQDESAPYNFRSAADPGHLTGIDADLARAVFDCIGVNIVFVTGAWSGLLSDVASGHSDLLWSGVFYTQERARQVDYVTYMSAGTGALVFKGNPQHVFSMGDLCGLRATAGMGTVAYSLLKQQSNECRAQRKPAVELVAYVTLVTGQRMLEDQRVDVLLTDLLVCSHSITAANEHLELAFPLRDALPIGIAVRKGQTELEHALQDAIGLMQADGTQQRVLARYGFDPSLQQTPRVIRD